MKKRIFLITIEILQNEWDYKIGQEIIIPVQSTTAHRAINKLERICCGSEYPNYVISEVTECDRFIFQPILE